MKRILLSLALLALSACAAGPPPNRYPLHSNQLHVSGAINRGITAAPGGLKIGLIADSQLQTRSNSRHVRLYRSPFADETVNVSIRPPALDYASRALLRRQLDNLRARGAQAIFYIGDGANNGCGDELLAGFDPEFPAALDDEKGLLRILDEFRQTEPAIPVFFVIGNHDFLGAGSTPKHREEFCRPDPEGSPRYNRALTKLQVMAAIDAFNKGNRDNWGYSSNFSAAHADHCGPSERQFTNRGCYLTAVLNKKIDGLDTQFVLLDSNDWVDVKRLWVFGDQLGYWGGISYKPGTPISQIEWIEGKTSDRPAMRLYMSHFNVGALVKKSLLGSLSHLSRHLPRLVSAPTASGKREAKQDDAYFVTAHTHTDVSKEHDSELLAPGCPDPNCKPTQEVVTKELNIGSTTDYRNSSTLVVVRPAANAKGSLEFEQVDADPAKQCSHYDAYIRANAASFGIIPGREFDYASNSHAQNMAIWDHLRGLSGGHPILPLCVGLYAAAVEEDALGERSKRRGRILE